MNDDLMTPAVISVLFETCHVVNSALDHKSQLSAEDIKEIADVQRIFIFDILGLRNEQGDNSSARENAFGKVVDMVLELRAQAKKNKDWATSDKIRDELAAAGFEVKDTKDGVTWKLDK